MEKTIKLIAEQKHTPSLLAANLYLLLGIGLIIGFGTLRNDVTPQYWIGIVVEVVLALLALGFMRIERLSVRETLRLRWPGWQPLAVSVVLAIGFWMIGVMLNVLAALVFGYTSPLPPSAFPKDIGSAIWLVISTTVAAPLCEEVMFRGYVQRAYDRWGMWMGMLIGGGIFALYHLRFQGVFALLPVSLALGFVAWRSNALLPGIVLHAVYNAIASVLLLATSFLPLQIVAGLIGAVVCVGVLVVPLALIVLWLFWQHTQPPVGGDFPKLHGWRRWVWGIPLGILLLIYGYAVVGEIIVGRFPEILAADALELQAPAWDASTRWSYVIHNKLDQPVGDAACALRTDVDAITLTCSAHHDAFESGLPFDIPRLDTMLSDEETMWTQTAVWSKEDLRLLDLRGTRQITQSTDLLTFSTRTDAHRLIFEQEERDLSATFVLSDDMMLADEWPWRLSALPFETGYGGYVSLVWVEDGGEAHVSEAYVGVRGGEPVWTPAGNFVAWKVTVTHEASSGEEITQTAWYDVDAPHTLVRYDHDTVSYLLSGYE